MKDNTGRNLACGIDAFGQGLEKEGIHGNLLKRKQCRREKSISVKKDSIRFCREAKIHLNTSSNVIQK